MSNKDHYLVKFPRIPHLPESPGKSSNDISINSVDELFADKLVVITEKMDGENTTITKRKVYARSLDSKDHPSRHWVKKLASEFQWALDDHIRICGENLYAKHSIKYTNLASYFYIFGIFKDHTYLNWHEVTMISAALGLMSVPIINKCKYYSGLIEDTIAGLDTTRCEGFVIRNLAAFGYSEFNTNIAKWVRPNHVQTDEHWLNQRMETNGIRI